MVSMVRGRPILKKQPVLVRESFCYVKIFFSTRYVLDKTPPEITCPNDINGTNLPGKSYGSVKWDEPIVKGTIFSIVYAGCIITLSFR